jgi:ABC-2 type transport system permease protein
MRGFRAVMRRELLGYFNTPMAYIVITAFLVFTSIWLFVIHDFFAVGIASLRSYYGIMPIVFVGLIPAVSMRMWPEERLTGTDEILLTLPVSEYVLVTGKYVAALALVLIAVALTAFVPLTVTRLGDFERGEIIGQYVGLVLLAVAGTGLGGLISALSRNQISAFLFTALTLLFLTLVGRVNAVIQLPSALAAALNYVSLDHHFRSLNRGVLDTRGVVYFLGIAAASLVVTTRVLVARKLR